MVGLKKILIILVTLFAFIKAQSQQSVLSLGVGVKDNLLAEFITPGKSNTILYGGGVSFFFNKGNKGKDYTGFVTDYTSTYETLYAKDGSIYFLIGNKLNRRVTWLMKFGMGVTTKYVNGKGIGNLPNELWYVRQRGYNEFLCGTIIQISSDISCIKIGWDSFNSFNLGIGVNINQK